MNHIDEWPGKNKKSFPWSRYNWHHNSSIKESFVKFFFPSFCRSVIKIIKEPVDLKNGLLEILRVAHVGKWYQRAWCLIGQLDDPVSLIFVRKMCPTRFTLVRTPPAEKSHNSHRMCLAQAVSPFHIWGSRPWRHKERLIVSDVTSPDWADSCKFNYKSTHPIPQ